MSEQTPLQKYAEEIETCQIIRSNQPGETLPIRTQIVLDLADYAAALEAELAARTQWPQGDEAARELARLNGGDNG